MLKIEHRHRAGADEHRAGQRRLERPHAPQRLHAEDDRQDKRGLVGGDGQCGANAGEEQLESALSRRRAQRVVGAAGRQQATEQRQPIRSDRSSFRS